MLEEARREEFAKIITMLVQMDETGITIITSNASVLLARQEAEKNKATKYLFKYPHKPKYKAVPEGRRKK